MHLESGWAMAMKMSGFAQIAVLVVGSILCVPAPRAWAGLVDPTSPYGNAPASTQRHHGGLQLQSTLVSPGRRLAIINGRTYRVGDPVGSLVVKEIQPYEVVLTGSGKTTRLRLLPGGTKVPSTTRKANP
jgi:MSHA biogenesis protein MshK